MTSLEQKVKNREAEIECLRLEVAAFKKRVQEDHRQLFQARLMLVRASKQIDQRLVAPRNHKSVVLFKEIMEFLK